MRKHIKVRKSSSFNTFDSFIFFLFAIYNCSIYIENRKIVVSVAVKSMRKYFTLEDYLGQNLTKFFFVIYVK